MTGPQRTPDHDSIPPRRIGLPSAVVLVVASMIGAGVFTTSGFSLEGLGSRTWVLLAWVVGGALAMLGALSYGAMARVLPESGGEYLFLSRTLHPVAGFLAGWISLIAGFTAPIAMVALALAAYLPWPDVSPQWIASTTIVVAGALHGIRARQGLVVQNLVVALKLILIGGFAVFGATHLPALSEVAAAGPKPFDLGQFCVALVWISLSYSGWNAAVYVGGEVRDPERNIPRSLWIGTALVTLVYLALNAVFVFAAPVEELAGKQDIAAVAARSLGGAALEGVMRGVIGLALFSSISAMVLAGPRVYAQMARDGLFPRAFASQRDAPGRAVALQVVLAVVVVWLSGLKALLSYVGFTLSLSAAATICALVVLRRREGAEAVPVPGYPWIPLLFVLPTLAIAFFMAATTGSGEQAAWGLATVASGLPVYAWMRRGSPDRLRGRSPDPP